MQQIHKYNSENNFQSTNLTCEAHRANCHMYGTFSVLMLGTALFKAESSII